MASSVSFPFLGTEPHEAQVGLEPLNLLLSFSKS